MWKFLAIVTIIGFAQINAQTQFCIRCDSSTDADCVNPESLDRFIQACPETNATGSCFTRVTPDGFTQRDCGSLLNNSQCESEFCTECQLIAVGSQPCNTMVLPIDRLTCYNCSGDFNSTCANLNGTDFRPIICPIFRNDDRCFGTRAGGMVTRGCQSSAPSGRCDNNLCTLCQGHGCNNINWPELNSAFGIHMMGKNLLLAIIAMIFLRFFSI